MNYSNFSNWISRQIKILKLRNATITVYLIFLMASSRKHTLTAAARFSDSSKSRFHYFLKGHSEAATYALSELSKKQARQFSKINTGLSTGNLPWNIAIIVDATIQNRSSPHTENSKRFNHGKGFVVGHQWTNIVLRINDKVIPLPPIPFYYIESPSPTGLFNLRIRSWFVPHTDLSLFVRCPSTYPAPGEAE